MTFFIQLTNQLQKFIPIEVIDKVLKYISIENLFRLGIDQDKLNYLTKFIPFENILEHPDDYLEYDYINRYESSWREYDNWSISKNLKFNMMNIPRDWYGNSTYNVSIYTDDNKFIYSVDLIKHIWFLCDPILFKCFIDDYPDMKQVFITKYQLNAADQFQLFFVHDRIDLLNLIPQSFAPKLNKNNLKSIFAFILSKNSQKCTQLLGYLLDLNGYGAEINKLAMYYSVTYNDRIEVVRWLIEKGQKWDSEIINLSASEGKLEILKLLHETHIEGCRGCTVDAMDNAVLFSNLDIVKYLCENRTE